MIKENEKRSTNIMHSAREQWQTFSRLCEAFGLSNDLVRLHDGMIAVQVTALR